MANLLTIENTGVKVATLDGAKERFDDLNKEVFGADIDVNIYTPQNQIAGINALVWAEVGEQVQRTALYGASLNHAPGRFLDSFGSLFGVKRRFATKTRVECELTGIDGTVVAAGSLVKNKQGDQFASEESVVITNGKATANFVALVAGPVPAGVGDVNEIITVTDPRWQSVINHQVGVIGSDEESDAEYRENLKRLTALSSSGTISALRSALIAAGANKVLILENSTDATAERSGIDLPARSLLVVVDGGITSDLTRAYEGYRPVGVSTHALAAASKPWIPADTSNINRGAFRYNGRDFTHFSLTSNSTISHLLSDLNGRSHGPSFISNGNTPILAYTWTPDTTGLEEIKGNAIQESVDSGLSLSKSIASPSSDTIVIGFDGAIDALDSASFSHTRTGDDAPEAIAVSSSAVWGNTATLTVSPSLPSDLESLTFSSVKVVASKIKEVGSSIVHNFEDVEAEIIAVPASNEAPTNTFVSGVPRTNGIAVNATALGTIDNWEYIRFDGVDYIDKDSNGNMEWQQVSPAQSGGKLQVTLNGFTNNRENARLHLRPYNASAKGEEKTIIFTCSSDRPVRDGDVIVDGNQIIVPFDKEMTATATSGTNLSWWTITAGSNTINVREQLVYQNKVYLVLQSAITANQVVGVRCSPSSSSHITSLSGVRPSSFTVPSANIINQSLAGLPSIPLNFRVFKTGNDKIKAVWEDNYDGGQTIDAYEYSISHDGGATWSAWNSLDDSVHQVEVGENTTSQLPNRIRARASNPNAQTLQKLGFTGLESLAPITRPVEHRLEISITLSDASSLVRDALNDIKATLVARVNQYEMGETIWVNDLLAVAELVQGVRITDISVTHGGTNVNNVSQPAYVNWTLRESDITFA